MSQSFIFLHGGGQGSWVWNETTAALQLQAGSDDVQCLALDVPGCGTKRGHTTDRIGPADVVTNLVSDIDRAALAAPILVGHSQAGTILPLLVKARPKVFQHVVYVSCIAPVGEQTSLNWKAAMPPADTPLLGDHSLGSREFFRRMFCNDMEPAVAERFLDRLGPDQWPSSSYSMSGWSYDHLVDVPSTYVLCLRDAALPPSWQEIFAARVHAKRIMRIDAGHQVMNTRPHALAETLRAIAAS